MAAKPLDIWQTPSSTHWQYPPKRSSTVQHFMVTCSRNEPCAHKYLGNCTNSGEQKRTGSRSFTLLERRSLWWAMRELPAGIEETGGSAGVLQSRKGRATSGSQGVERSGGRGRLWRCRRHQVPFGKLRAGSPLRRRWRSGSGRNDRVVKASE